MQESNVEKCGKIVEVITMNIATWVIAVFTIVLASFTGLLWLATRKYSKVTGKLLEQNKESFDLSRKAFLADIISRTMYCATHLRFHTKTERHFEPYIKGVYDAVKGIDPDLAKELMTGWKSWSEGQGKGMDSIYKNIPGMLEKKEE